MLPKGQTFKNIKKKTRISGLFSFMDKKVKSKFIA